MKRWLDHREGYINTEKAPGLGITSVFALYPRDRSKLDIDKMEALLNLYHEPQGGQVNSTILPTTDSDIENLLDFCHGSEGEREPSIPPPQESVTQPQEGQGETEPSMLPEAPIDF